MKYILLFVMSFSAYGYDRVYDRDRVDRDIDRYNERARYDEMRREQQQYRAWDKVDRDARDLDRKLERARPCYDWQTRCD